MQRVSERKIYFTENLHNVQNCSGSLKDFFFPIAEEAAESGFHTARKTFFLFLSLCASDDIEMDYFLIKLLIGLKILSVFIGLKHSPGFSAANLLEYCSS